MLTLLDSIYFKLRKEEIEKACTKFKRIKIDTILQSLTKHCWEYNIQYRIIIKTSSLLTIKLSGNRETVVFKYHKADMVRKKETDFFMSELDEHSASKGFYVTTGRFEKKEKNISRKKFLKKDVILEDGFTFIKGQLGVKGTALSSFQVDKFNFFKYLPQ